MNGNKKTPVKGDDIKSILTNSPQVSGGSGSVTRSSVLTGKVPSSTTSSNETRQLPPLKNDGRVEMAFNPPGRGSIKPLVQAWAAASGVTALGSMASYGNQSSLNLRERFDKTRLGTYLNARDEYMKNAPKASKNDSFKDIIMKGFRMGEYKGNPPKF
jgi:hypothetical protein